MSETTDIRFGPFRLLGRHGPLLRGDQEIRLQPKTMAVLWTLTSHPGEMVTRSALMDAVWPGVVVGDEALTYQVQALRRAIEEDPRQPRYVVTAHRVGFRLVVPEQPRSGTALFGREEELRELFAAHARAAGGLRQFVFVCGEAGIGKTALLDDFLARLRSEAPPTRICRAHCLEVTGESEAYQPILDALDQGVRTADGDELLEQLRQRAPTWLRQLPRLLMPDENERLRRTTAGAPPERQRRELAEALEAFTARYTLVLLIEDLHWSDASTVALLGLLAQREEAARLLIICSCRPVESIVNQHPARALQLGLTARGRAQALSLLPLQAADAQHLVERQLPGAGAGLKAKILHRGGGHPLFLVHLAEYLRHRTADPTAVQAVDDELPPQLRDLIELHLSQLTASEQLLLEIGAIAGQTFAAAAVAAGSGIAADAVEEALESMALRRLFVAERGLAIWPDGTVSGRFQFRHAMYEQALRQRPSLSRAARLHRRLAERLELAYVGRGEEVATELAHHYEAGGGAAKAAEWCAQAAQNALDRVAPHEVRQQVDRGLALLVPLAPDLQRHRTELRLRIVASRSLQIENGYGGAAAFEHRDRIDSLIDLVGDDPVLIAAVQVQWLSRQFNSEFERARALGERLRDIGRAAGLTSLECAGLGWAGHSLHNLGQHELAGRYAAESCQLAFAGGQVNPAVAPDAMLTALGVHALTRWFLGFPEQALALADHASIASERIGNPYLHCMVVCASRGLLLEFTGDHARLLELAAEALELARHCGHLEGQRWAMVLLGVAQCHTGDPEGGLRLLQPVLDEMQRQGAVLLLPLGLVGAARACAGLGQHERARQSAERALQLIRQRGHRPWEPEVLRTLGELRLMADPRALAAATVPLWEALELARARKTLSLELRVATSLARMQRDRGLVAEALELLEPVLARFTEGAGLPDQQKARALIASMRYD